MIRGSISEYFFYETLDVVRKGTRRKKKISYMNKSEKNLKNTSGAQEWEENRRIRSEVIK